MRSPSRASTAPASTDNWSLSTDTGKNLFKPGSTPRQNAQFLLFLAAFVKGVDDYQDFLRATVAFPGNDHRLGAQEAPPAVLSIFLGDELSAVVGSIINVVFRVMFGPEMDWEEPSIRNSNLLPVKAMGEVRFRSVLSWGIAGRESTPIFRAWRS